MIEQHVFSEDDIYNINIGKYKGRWRARIPISKDTEQKTYRYKSIIGDSKQEVRQKADEFISEQMRRTGGGVAKDSLSTDMERFLRSKYGSIKPTSYDRLEVTYKRQIRPYINGWTLKSVKSEDCKNLLNSLAERGLSYSTIKKALLFLKAYFRARILDGSIIINPMNTVTMFSHEHIAMMQAKAKQAKIAATKKLRSGSNLTAEEEGFAFSTLKMEDEEEIRTLTNDEIAKIKDVARNGYVIKWTTSTGKVAEMPKRHLKQALFFIFILNTGIRRGEAVGLKYSDIDFKNRTMTISRNLVEARNRDAYGVATKGIRVVVSTPKTKKSRATVPINDTAVKILKELKKEEKKGYNGYIVNSNGAYITGHALSERWEDVLKWAGVRQCGIHSLRHTYASRAYEITKGNSKFVSQMVRHASTSFTEETYVHLSNEYERALVDSIEI